MQRSETALKEANKLAEHLTTIPECPRGELAIEALADDLLEICQDRAEMRWLVHEARARWERWQGTKGLRELVRSRTPEPDPPNQFMQYEPSPVDCSACNDFGFFTRNRKSQFCDCSQGEALRERFPDFVEKLNSKGITKPIMPTRERRHITEEELSREIERRRKSVQ